MTTWRVLSVVTGRELGTVSLSPDDTLIFSSDQIEHMVRGSHAGRSDRELFDRYAGGWSNAYIKVVPAE